MKVGDPRKAAVLGAIAVIVSGVAVYRVLPGPEVAISQLVVPMEEKPPELKQTVYPLTINHDPFSHPLLQKDGVRPVTHSPSGDPTETESPMPVTIGGQLPDLNPADPASTGAQHPEDFAGNDRETNGESQTVRLDAVMSAGETVAVLRLGDNEPVVCKQGDVAFGLVKVEKISLSGVQLSSQGHEWQLKIGDSVKI